MVDVDVGLCRPSRKACQLAPNHALAAQLAVKLTPCNRDFTEERNIEGPVTSRSHHHGK
jgi:hypothetical protein